MAVPEHERVSADDFLRWVVTQSERFELVDGRIVRMMAGTRQNHAVVASNILVALAPQAKRGGCRTTASDVAVRTSLGGIRYPDVVVDCGPPDPAALAAVRPVLVVEVSSPGTTTIDATDKLDEYRAHADIRVIALVEPDIVSLKLYRRDPEGEWRVERYDDLSDIIELPEIGASLSLVDLYDTLHPTVRPKFQLVGGRLPEGADR